MYPSSQKIKTILCRNFGKVQVPSPQGVRVRWAWNAACITAEPAPSLLLSGGVECSCVRTFS
jgi:hypothetical protein